MCDGIARLLKSYGQCQDLVCKNKTNSKLHDQDLMGKNKTKTTMVLQLVITNAKLTKAFLPTYLTAFSTKQFNYSLF